MDLVSITQAKARSGLRLVTRRGIPTPWAQAAKGIIEVKGLACVLAQESAEDPKGAHADWVGAQGSPFLAYNDEPLRDGWAEILELAERLGPDPALIPSGGPARAEMYGLANELCGEMGLGWSLRLLMVDGSLSHPDRPGAFPARVASYLGRRYGYHPDCAERAERRVRTVLETLSNRLGEEIYFFGSLTALDIYWAAFGNMFLLLNDTELPAAPMALEAWRHLGGGRFTNEVPENLKAHHRRLYREHLTLPVQL